MLINYKKIKNPITKKYVNIYSKIGVEILKKYLYNYIQYGSSNPFRPLKSSIQTKKRLVDAPRSSKKEEDEKEEQLSSEINDWKTMSRWPEGIRPQHKHFSRSAKSKTELTGFTSSCGEAAKIRVIDIIFDEIMKALPNKFPHINEEILQKNLQDYKKRWIEFLLPIFSDPVNIIKIQDNNFQALYKRIIGEGIDIDKLNGEQKILLILENMDLTPEIQQKHIDTLRYIYQSFFIRHDNSHIKLETSSELADILEQSKLEPIIFFIKKIHPSTTQNPRVAQHWFYIYNNYLYTTYGIGIYVDKELAKKDIELRENNATIFSELKIIEKNEKNISLFIELLSLLETGDVQQENRFNYLYRYFFLGNEDGLSLKCNDSRVTPEQIQEEVNEEINENLYRLSRDENKASIVYLYGKHKSIYSHIKELMEALIPYHYQNIYQPVNIHVLKELAK